MQQILPSVIWLTKPAELVVRAHGLDPAQYLRVLTPTSQRHAGVEMRVLTLQTCRSIIAGFVGIAQILRVMDIFKDASAHYEGNLLAGREPLFRGTVTERVVRLAGTGSDVTEFSWSRHGSHILAVHEDPASVAAEVEALCAKREPCIWHIPSGGYGKPGNWRGFVVDRDWLLPVHGGVDGKPARRALVIEADASVGEEALALGSETANDLTPQEASQGFRAVQRRARESGALLPDDVVVRVLLANGSTPVVSGGGAVTKLRAHLEATNEVDVFVDAQAPLLQAVLGWAKAAVETGGVRSGSGGEALTETEATAAAPGRVIVFDTHNAKYFRTVKTVLARAGWTVIDRPSGVAHTGVPRIVYQDSTSDTVNTIHSLINAGAAPNLVCALIDRHEGVVEVEELSQRLGQRISSICSAVIYEDIFAKIRFAVRNGTGAADIQAEMDATVNCEAGTGPTGGAK